MRAAVIDRLGDASEIAYREVPDAVAGDGRVLVRPEAVAVDHVDGFVRSGAYRTALHFPQVIGRDLVGVVIDDPSGAFGAGERVWTNSAGYDGRPGATAELVPVDADRLYRAPESADPVSFVALLHPGATAFAVLERGRVRAGDVVAITGATGAVGSVLVQLAAAIGCRVIAVVRDAASAEELERLGAAAVAVADGDGALDAAVAAAGSTVDVLVECSGHTDLERFPSAMSRRGRMVLVSARRPFEIRPQEFYTRELALEGLIMSGLAVDELAESAPRIVEAWGRGVRVPVAPVLPFSAARAAHELLEADGPPRTGTGMVPRIVLVPESLSPRG